MAKSVDDGGAWFTLQNSGGAGRIPVEAPGWRAPTHARH